MIFGIKRTRGDSLCSEIIALSIDLMKNFISTKAFILAQWPRINQIASLEIFSKILSTDTSCPVT